MSTNETESQAGVINMWLPAALRLTATRTGELTTKLSATHTAVITYDDGVATVTLLKGYGVIGQQHISFSDPNINDYLVAQAVTAYADMVDAEVIA